MKNKLVFGLFAFSFLVAGHLVAPAPLHAQGMGVDLQTVPPQDMMELKRAWRELSEHYGELVAQVSSEKGPDWQKIQKLLRYMQTDLRQMWRADSAGRYDRFLNTLGEDLKVLQGQAKAENPQLLEGVRALEQKCFRCHSTHRIEKPRSISHHEDPSQPPPVDS